MVCVRVEAGKHSIWARPYKAIQEIFLKYTDQARLAQQSVNICPVKHEIN